MPTKQAEFKSGFVEKLASYGLEPHQAEFVFGEFKKQAEEGGFGDILQNPMMLAALGSLLGGGTGYGLGGGGGGLLGGLGGGALGYFLPQILKYFQGQGGGAAPEAPAGPNPSVPTTLGSELPGAKPGPGQAGPPPEAMAAKQAPMPMPMPSPAPAQAPMPAKPEQDISTVDPQGRGIAPGSEAAAYYAKQRAAQSDANSQRLLGPSQQMAQPPKQPAVPMKPLTPTQPPPPMAMSANKPIPNHLMS